MILGVLIVSLGISLPAVGVIISVIVVVLGAGAFVVDGRSSRMHLAILRVRVTAALAAASTGDTSVLCLGFFCPRCWRRDPEPDRCGVCPATVGREEIPDRTRRILNTESGVNDGLATPLVILLLEMTSRDPLEWADWREKR